MIVNKNGTSDPAQIGRDQQAGVQNSHRHKNARHHDPVGGARWRRRDGGLGHPGSEPGLEPFPDRLPGRRRQLDGGQSGSALSGSTKFRVFQPGPVTVRVQMSDVAGNRSEMPRDVPDPGRASAVNATMPVVSPQQQRPFSRGTPLQQGAAPLQQGRLFNRERRFSRERLFRTGNAPQQVKGVPPPSEVRRRR